MRKILLLAMAVASAAGSYAEVELPQPTFQEDFKSGLPEGSYLPEGWITYGKGNVVDGPFQPYFGADGEAPYYRTFTIENKSAAWSCSTFKYADDADEWLVTPVIHVDSDTEVLELTAVSSGAYATNKYRVLVSETGQDKESFGRIPVLNASLVGWETEVRENKSYVALNGYADKDICLAFVNKSKDCGMLGFTDISISPYAIDVTDLTPSIAPAGTVVTISANVSIYTPLQVDGITARLTTTTGIDRTVEFDRNIDIQGARMLVSFDNIPVEAGGMGYTLTLTPRYEGAEPSVVTGEISTPTTSYAPVVVIEEFTGTWCSNCVRGAAYLNYFHDKYDGLEGRVKAIGIALHTDNDPMLMTDDSYLRTAMSVAGAVGYPSAFFNRETQGDPSFDYIVKDIADTRSNSVIRINRVNYQEGGPVKVDFEIENSYSKKNMNQRVAMVIVENDVRGTTPHYNQTNGLAGVSKTAIENTFGPELWEYFKVFCEGENPIKYDKMVYRHVARGIYPDYYGMLFNESCVAETPVELTMSMEMPGQVDKQENTAVILLLLDGDNGKVLSAAEVEAEYFNTDFSGVENTSVAGNMDNKIVLNGNTLTVTSIESSALDIYSADGRKLYSGRVDAGINEVSVSGLSGLMIATLSNGNGAPYVAKLMK